MTKTNERVLSVMRECGIPCSGVAPFAALRGKLLSCSGLRRLPTRPAAVIVSLFPYYTGPHPEANLSVYAIPEDYHTIVGVYLRRAAEMLREEFPDRAFTPFCDASPVPEVEAARLAGLGDIGDHGLLISPDYGSYVFIGEIVTDLALEPCAEPGGACLRCGACARACPAGVIGSPRKKAECLSAVTQKKGALCGEESARIRQTGCLWGCDVCQNVCPLNRSARQTGLPEFRVHLKERIEAGELDGPEFSKLNANRAFMWRGIGPLRRNIGIIRGDPTDNKTESELNP